MLRDDAHLVSGNAHRHRDFSILVPIEEPQMMPSGVLFFY